MSILNGFKTFERYLKTPNGYQLYSERQLAKDVLMGDGTNENNNVESNLTQLSNPNLLINGDFQVWQRGTEFVTSGANGFRYKADRWCSWDISTGLATKKVTNGIQTQVDIRQYLETRLTQGQNYVLSVSVDNFIYTLNIVGGTPIGTEIFSYGVGDNFDHIVIAGDMEYKKVINWVKLEQGTVATPFVPRLYAEELMLCKRYYEYFTNLRIRCYLSSANSGAFYVVPYTEKRINPSIAYDNLTAHSMTEETLETSFWNYSSEKDKIIICANNTKVDSIIKSSKFIVDAEVY